jgi:hypothetical protein
MADNQRFGPQTFAALERQLEQMKPQRETEEQARAEAEAKAEAKAKREALANNRRLSWELLV